MKQLQRNNSILNTIPPNPITLSKLDQKYKGKNIEYYYSDNLQSNSIEEKEFKEKDYKEEEEEKKEINQSKFTNRGVSLFSKEKIVSNSYYLNTESASN